MDPRKAVSGDSPRSSSPRTPEIPAEDRPLSPRKSPDDAKDGSQKKHVWNKPSNGSGSSATTDVGSVMGAVSWPTLSETTRVQAKPTYSGNSLSDGSSVSEAPVMQESPRKPNQIPNTNPIQNHAFVIRQRSFNRRGNNANGGTNFWDTESSPHNEQAQKDPLHKNNLDSGMRGPGSQGQNGNDHPRNSYRRGNGQHPRAETPHHYGNRGNAHNQDRANYEWNPNRGYGSRDMHHQQRVGPRNFVRHPSPLPPPFISMPRGYGNPMGYPDMGTQVYYVPPAVTDHIPGVPFMSHAPPPFVFLPQPDPQLPALLVGQIEYYFSPGNLCKDIFLRKNMDEQGWVSISLIANFNMVKKLTYDIPLILDCLRGSSILEIQGDKIRKRNDWKNWLLPNNSSPSSSNVDLVTMPSIDSLATQIRGFGLDGSRVTHGEVPYEFLSRSSSEASQSFSYQGEDRTEHAQGDVPIKASGL